ncbi:MAG: hypothetical protein II225_03540, partial [Ruminococcus sp.]|nr:hypothetical protein [Ruminococcus sp.]
ALVLESDTYLKFYFKVDEENLNASVPTITINGVYTELEKNGNLWFAKMPSLDADDYADQFVLEISNGYTVTYSANSYIYTAQNSGKEALVAVANALSAYGNATAVFAPVE